MGTISKSFINFLLLTTLLSTALCCCQSSCTTKCCSVCKTECSTSRCVDYCKKDCCSKQDCTTTKPSTKSTETENIQTPIRFESTISSILPEPKKINVLNQIQKSDTYNVNITNSISNYNNVLIPVKVNLVNTNHVYVHYTGGTRKTGPTPSPTQSCKNLTEVITIFLQKNTSSITEATPTSTLPSTTTTTILTTPTVPTSGCCMVTVPCVRRACSEWRFSCGNYCRSGRPVYIPVDPCQQGCYRSNTNYCGRRQYNCRMVDCNQCDYDFYKQYHSYSLCKRCFSHQADFNF